MLCGIIFFLMPCLGVQFAELTKLTVAWECLITERRVRSMPNMASASSFVPARPRSCLPSTTSSRKINEHIYIDENNPWGNWILLWSSSFISLYSSLGFHSYGFYSILQIKINIIDTIYYIINFIIT